MLRTKIILFLISFCFISKLSYSQEETYKEPKGTNNCFVELGGAGLFYSINYEKYLYKSFNEKLTWTGRIGGGYNPIPYRLLNSVYLEDESFMFPFTSSIFYGNRKERIEIGAGYTLLTQDFSSNQVIPTFILGFRVTETNGTFFRVAYTPHLRDNVLVTWFGVSIGRNFNFK